VIGKLRGQVDSTDSEGLILDVGGVGYVVFASARTLNRLPAPGGDAKPLDAGHRPDGQSHPLRQPFSPLKQIFNKRGRVP
jgi:Holliday junction DNA helicase RuvA